LWRNINSEGQKIASIGQHHMAGMKASLCQILSRRAIRKRPKVVNQVGLIRSRKGNICPIHLRFASQQIKDLLQASNATKQF